MIKSALVLGMCALHGISGGPDSTVGETKESSGEDISLTSCSNPGVSSDPRVDESLALSGSDSSGSGASSR